MAVEFKEEDITVKVDETFEDIALPPLQQYVFHKCNFKHVAFRHDLHNIQFIDCNMRDCYFDPIKIDNCAFINSCFRNTLFTHICIYNTTFYKCSVARFCAFYDVGFNKSKFIKTTFYTSILDIYTHDRNDKIFDKSCDFSGTSFVSDMCNTDDLQSVTSSYGKETILRESIIGYKKCQNGDIVTLEIPAGAVIFSPNGGKCRTNKVKVLKIEDIFKEEIKRTRSLYTGMSYYVGDEITVHNFDLRYNLECSTGIHFFMTRKEAEYFYF